MYFGDFARLVRRYASPSSQLQFLKTRSGPSDVVTIMDYSLPRRNGVCLTGWTEQDWYRDSVVCNVGYLGGEIPLYNIHGKFVTQNSESQKVGHFEKRPARGVIDALSVLLKDAVICPSSELDTIIGMDTRRLCPSYMRLLYVR